MASTNPTTLDAEQKSQIKEIVCEVLEIDGDEVTETSRFKEEHDADSLRAIEILAAPEGGPAHHRRPVRAEPASLADVGSEGLVDDVG